MPVVHKYEDSELDILIEKELYIREQFNNYSDYHDIELSVEYFIKQGPRLIFILEITID